MRVTKKHITTYLVLSLLSITLFTLVSLLTYFGFDYKLIGGSLIYFIIPFLVLKSKYLLNSFIAILLITLPVLIVILVINIIDFKSSWVSLPSNVFLLASSFTAYFFYKSKNYVFPVFLLATILIWQYRGDKLFHNFIQFGTLNGKINQPIGFIQLYDRSGIASKIKTFSKTIILDFWNSHCGPCFKQFPIIDSINKKIDTTLYEIIVVNIPLNGEKKEDNYSLLDSFNYTFKQAFAKDNTILDSLKIEYFPTTIIIKENKIVFRGDFRDALKLEYLK